MAKKKEYVCAANNCAEGPFKSGQARNKHYRETHPELVKTRVSRKVTSAGRPMLEVPAHFEGTAIGDSIEILLEQRKANADEVARIDKAIRGLLEGK